MKEFNDRIRELKNCMLFRTEGNKMFFYSALFLYITEHLHRYL
jgi:hypothetical protein